jgi:hypothetical protein
MIKAQCFSCYDDARFRYEGQTGKFNPRQVQLDYVEGLRKHGTKIDCVSCARKVEYVEKEGKWTEVVA